MSNFDTRTTRQEYFKSYFLLFTGEPFYDSLHSPINPQPIFFLRFWIRYAFVFKFNILFRYALKFLSFFFLFYKISYICYLVLKVSYVFTLDSCSISITCITFRYYLSVANRHESQKVNEKQLLVFSPCDFYF